MTDHRYRPDVEILFVTNTGRRRRWTDAQKVRIIEASHIGGVAETARRHDVGRRLLVRWRRQYREGHFAGGAVRPQFMPVTIGSPEVSKPEPLLADDRTELAEITLVNARRLSVAATIDPGVLSRLVQALDPSCLPFRRGEADQRACQWKDHPT
jgi:transposase